MTRVIHTGDTHIGYQQYHSPERRRDFLDAFEQVVEDAVSEDVDAVVHAGDLFHDRRPELRDLLGTLSALRRLEEADVPFLAIVGNHESTRGGQWLDLFENLGLAERLGREPRVVGDTAFYGLDHVPESRRDDLTYDFEPHDAAHAALVAHGLFTPFAHANWETETVLAESNVAFDAVLLGDNHAPGVEEVRDTWVTYCGSTERASTSEEPGRGYNIVAFDGEVDIRRKSLDTRPFRFVSVELKEGEGVERVREQVRQHDLTDAVVVVEVTGEGEPVTPASIEEFAAERGALIARVTDRRELETESSLDVTFADPDDAVRERVSDLGLSTAARDVDETIRASKTPDSKVREEVRSRVASLMDDGDLSAFESAEPSSDAGEGDGSEAGSETDADDPSEGDETADAVSAEESPPDEVAVETPAAAEDGRAATVGADADADATADTDMSADADAETDTDADPAADGEAGPDAESETERDATEPDAETNGQFTMEDF
ncbi:DNA double-strand break repair protein Mre11 [Halopelagius longus]|uniref:DNA double-strand break repair protein Mre11 n=1 Tax=Halopelagius longus TaxID=1236180 RepID=A0A1H1C984_9EURY|nr:DNA double-strand break repair protein Mre11 [Halopelagius longus]RDI71125.1 exonuclease SbcCD subunit D [Halopelagius longus]SDQ60659.1 DNA repair exonuclease SbcCD nuclease subunit [Halopelagius longus]